MPARRTEREDPERELGQQHGQRRRCEAGQGARGPTIDVRDGGRPAPGSGPSAVLRGQVQKAATVNVELLVTSVWK